MAEPGARNAAVGAMSAVDTAAPSATSEFEEEIINALSRTHAAGHAVSNHLPGRCVL